MKQRTAATEPLIVMTKAGLDTSPHTTMELTGDETQKEKNGRNGEIVKLSGRPLPRDSRAPRWREAIRVH